MSSDFEERIKEIERMGNTELATALALCEIARQLARLVDFYRSEGYQLVHQLALSRASDTAAWDALLAVVREQGIR